MLRCAVISCGASGAMFNPDDGWDLVVGVSRVGLWCRTDWLVLYDKGAYERHFGKVKPIGNPWIYSAKNSMDSNGAKMSYDDDAVLMNKDLLVNTYSAINAIACAEALGATEIHLYGYDLKGNADRDGWVSETRNNQQWIHQGFLLVMCQQELASRGRGMVRHLDGYDDGLGEPLCGMLGRFSVRY